MPARPHVRRRVPAPVSQSLDRLGERLRKARIEAGLSQAQLGAPHFTRAYVSALELGKIRPAMKSLEFIAAKLGKSIAHFMDDEEKEQKRRERELSLTRANQLIAQGAAREAIQELSAIPTEDLSLPERLSIKRTLGRAYLEAGQAGRAAAVLTDAVRGYEASGDEEQVARTRAQLGGALITLMDYSEAEGHLQAALGDVGDQKWLASVFAAIGMSRRQMGDYEGAITCLLKSEALFDALHNKARVAEIRFQTGRTLRALGNKTRAEEVLGEALRAAREAGSEPLAVRIEAFIGLTEAQDGRYGEARERLEQLVSRADRVDDPGAQFAARFALAKTLTNVDPEHSVSLLRELARVLEERAAATDLADVYDELSKALGKQGRSEEALAYAQRAYATSLHAKGGV